MVDPARGEIDDLDAGSDDVGHPGHVRKAHDAVAVRDVERVGDEGHPERCVEA
jgi:hypothetical protein